MPVIYFNLFWSENKENWWVAAQASKREKRGWFDRPICGQRNQNEITIFRHIYPWSIHFDRSHSLVSAAHPPGKMDGNHSAESKRIEWSQPNEKPVFACFCQFLFTLIESSPKWIQTVGVTMQHLTALGFVAFVEGIYTQQDHFQLHPSFGHCELETPWPAHRANAGGAISLVYTGALPRQQTHWEAGNDANQQHHRHVGGLSKTIPSSLRKPRSCWASCRCESSVGRHWRLHLPKIRLE